jgi:peptidoglycan-associated lipoprotein
MKHPEASQWMLGGMAVVLLAVPGCSSMSGFHSGSDDTAVSETDRLGDHAQGQGARNGQFPPLSRQYPLSDAEVSAETEGGALRGFSPLVNGRITGEERLSRSSMGGMLMPVDGDEKWHAEIRREEAAAMEVGLKDVFYGYDRYNVSDSDGAVSLTENALWLKDNPKSHLRISGHCDERGTHDYNLVLGEKRAKAAKSFLVDLGVSPKQVAIVSYGKDRPFCADHDEVCHQQNRRGHMLLRK